MTKDDILKLVRESYERGQSDLMESCKEAAAKAIESAILAEREACAKLCEEYRDEWLKGRGRYEFMGEGADYLADFIRARSNP
jgi:hypothetical protein